MQAVMFVNTMEYLQVGHGLKQTAVKDGQLPLEHFDVV